MPARRAVPPALPGLLLGAMVAAAQARLPADQQQWLQRQGPVRFAPEADYGPFVYVGDQGRVEGLSVDMLQLVQRHTGLQVQILPPRPLTDNLLAAREGRVDLLSSLRPTPERSAYLAFTAPYVNVPAIVVTRGPADDADGTQVLRRLAGHRVAVGQGYAVEAVMRERHPKVQWVSVRDDVVALKMLAGSEVDAAVADAASVSFVVRHHGLAGLHSAGRVGYDYPLAFAVRKDWLPLRDIIDGGIRAISPQERDAVMARWAPELGPARGEPRLGALVSAGLAMLVLSMAGMLWALRRRLRAPRDDA